MHTRWIHSILVGACATAIAGFGTARAEEHKAAKAAKAEITAAYGEGSLGEAYGGLTLPDGKIFIFGEFNSNLSSDNVVKPFSIAPDIWYGVSSDLTVGLVHSNWGQTGFVGTTQGPGLCLTGETQCNNVYNNVGVNALYGVLDKNIKLAADAGLYARQLDPFQMALKAGVRGSYALGKIGLLFNPNLYIGFSNRTVMDIDSNKEVLNLPVAAVYMLNNELGFAAQTGVMAPLSNFGDNWRLPVSLGARYAVTQQLGLGAIFSFPNLAAGDSVMISGASARSLQVHVGYML